ncbi:hypothetical protein [Deinococcus sp. LM3]|nr:hypothetical protein [Deinococcus sp. LM3]
MDSKGRVLVSIHNTQYDTTSIFRLNPDGTYDNTFSSVTLNIASHLRHYNKIRALSGGEIVFSYVSGEVDQNISIIKILENGTLDGKFGKQGKLDIDLGSSEDILIDTEIDSRDQIVIFGRTKNLNRAIIKLNKNGEAVTSFGESGRLNLDSDKDVLFDELELKNQNIVLYDSYTRGESTAVEIDESGKSKRFNFSRPSNYENGRTTLSKVVWNSRLSRYIGYGDLEISSSSFSDRGVIYSFFE